MCGARRSLFITTAHGIVDGGGVLAYLVPAVDVQHDPGVGGCRLTFETNGLKALYFQEVETKWFQQRGVNLMSTCTALPCSAADADVCLHENVSSAPSSTASLPTPPWSRVAQAQNKGFKLKAMFILLAIKL